MSRNKREGVYAGKYSGNHVRDNNGYDYYVPTCITIPSYNKVVFTLIDRSTRVKYRLVKL